MILNNFNKKIPRTCFKTGPAQWSSGRVATLRLESCEFKFSLSHAKDKKKKKNAGGIQTHFCKTTMKKDGTHDMTSGK